METNTENPSKKHSYSDEEIKNNPKEVLADVIDEEKKRESFDYSLRKRILILSGGAIQTYEAFVKDSWILDPLNITYEERETYLYDQQNWLEERVVFHNQIIGKAFNLGLSLSSRVREKMGHDYEPKVFMVRGNIGAGKTQALRTHDMFLVILDEQGKPTGVISPDNFKGVIREEMGRHAGRHTISHFQSHEESLVIARRLEDQLFAEPGVSIAFDERFAYKDRIESLLEFAIKHGKNIEILDLDVPVEISIIRNLKRDSEGKDPCVPYDVIKDGFISIRQTRSLILEFLDNTQITYYLLSEGSTTPLTDVAEKSNSGFQILNSNLFYKVKNLGKDDARKLSELDSKIVDDSYIKYIRHLLDKQELNSKERLIILDIFNKNKGKLLRLIVDEQAK